MFDFWKVRKEELEAKRGMVVENLSKSVLYKIVTRKIVVTYQPESGSSASVRTVSGILSILGGLQKVLVGVPDEMFLAELSKSKTDYATFLRLSARLGGLSAKAVEARLFESPSSKEVES
jgi:hypothetical protein